MTDNQKYTLHKFNYAGFQFYEIDINGNSTYRNNIYVKANDVCVKIKQYEDDLIKKDNIYIFLHLKTGKFFYDDIVWYKDVVEK